MNNTDEISGLEPGACINAEVNSSVSSVSATALAAEPDSDSLSVSDSVPNMPVIGGFEGSRAFYLEPSLYLSILVVVIAAAVYLNSTPVIFLTATAVLITVVVLLHAFAERLLRPTDGAATGAVGGVPESRSLGGIFVVAFGAMLPGLGLLFYAVYAMLVGAQFNLLEEVGKLTLLLLVPLLNFSVWCAVNRGFLARPRLTAVMNGLAIGLSLSWSVLWFYAVCFPSLAVCKFGWMLLLSVSPFMLAAAAWLNCDICRRTGARIARLTKVFSFLGAFVATVVVFAPVGRAYYVQTLIDNARLALGQDPAKQVEALQALSLATPEDLRPSEYATSGLTLAKMLIAGRGLSSGSIQDRVIYFKVTGKSYDDQVAPPQAEMAKYPGLSLAQTAIDGSVDSASLTANLDWNMTFHSSASGAVGALSEIVLPEGAVVSRAVLLSDTVQEAVPVPMALTATDDSRARDRGDKVILVQSAKDRLCLQINAVPGNGGEARIRLHMTLPLETEDGKIARLKLPYFSHSNFNISRRLRLNIKCNGNYIASPQDSARLVYTPDKEGIQNGLKGLLKTSSDGLSNPLCFTRNTINGLSNCFVVSYGKMLIEQKLTAHKAFSPRRLYVVADTSQSMRFYKGQLNRAISALGASSIPCKLCTVSSALPKTSEANDTLSGEDNYGLLKETLEEAAEQEGAAVLWVHGPQISEVNAAAEPVLDLVNKVHFYDLQLVAGENNVLPAIMAEDYNHQLVYKTVEHRNLPQDLQGLVSDWHSGAMTMVLSREEIKNNKNGASVSGIVGESIGNLWAANKANRLAQVGMFEPARTLAMQNHLLTQATGLITFATAREQHAAGYNPEAFKAPGLNIFTGGAVCGGGLVGAPVDPRYGQSNQVGRLSDYGYDFARDMSRLVTLLSALAAFLLAFLHLRRLRAASKTGLQSLLKTFSIAIAVPLVVHLVATFVINNFGGLGGGL